MKVLVSGAGRGIGRAVTELLLAAGHEVAAAVRDPARAETSPGSVPVALDLTRAGSPEAAVAEALAQLGEIDSVVLNAGISNLGAVEDQHDAELERVLDTNYFGHERLLRSLLPHFRERRGGRVVAVSSLSGLFGLPGESAYCVSKFAMEALCQCLRHEVRPFGVHVSVVNPSYTRTDLAGATELDRATPLASPYRALMMHLLEIQQAGEREGDDPGLVADAIVEALTSKTPALRYLPGSAQALFEAWKGMPEQEFDALVSDSLSMDWWQSTAS